MKTNNARQPMKKSINSNLSSKIENVKKRKENENSLNKYRCCFNDQKAMTIMTMKMTEYL